MDIVPLQVLMDMLIPMTQAIFFSGYIWINDSTSREAPSKISPNQDPGTQDLPSWEVHVMRLSMEEPELLWDPRGSKPFEIPSMFHQWLGDQHHV